MSELKRLHTVTLDKDKCTGCFSCVKRCPTQAIRVYDGKASVIYDKCIACGECVRVCASHAKVPSYDKLSVIDNYKYKIALLPPSFYGQFNGVSNINIVLTALQRIGFNFVYEVGVGAELVSQATQKLIAQDVLKKPIISTACPAVLELINERFQHLQDNLLPLLPPVEVSAKLAREKAIRHGANPDEIGLFFISPCPAKVYALKAGKLLKDNYVDGVLSVAEVYMKLAPEIGKIAEGKNLSEMGILGMQWGSSGGEAAGAKCDRYLAADGIENVMSILEALENGSLTDVEFIELNACVGGCVGGVLNVENPFIAKARLRQLRNKFPKVGNYMVEIGKPLDFYKTSQRLQGDDQTFAKSRQLAFDKLKEIQQRYQSLPQIDCGACGAPSCRAFCEDIAMGRVSSDTVCPKKVTQKGLLDDDSTTTSTKA